MSKAKKKITEIKIENKTSKYLVSILTTIKFLTFFNKKNSNIKGSLKYNVQFPLMNYKTKPIN